MSGWIKKEKDLRDDPRVWRMARQLAERYASVTNSNGGALLSVTLCRTLVLGALDQIWMHGDSFARVDDTLETTLDELDNLVGLPGFCSLMPADWLTQDIAGTVKLVDFGTKNSPEAKAAALNAARQQRHRARKDSNGGALLTALPDRQTRHTDQPEEDARARAAPVRLPSTFALTPPRRQFALDQQIDPARTFKKFCIHWQHADGPTATKRDWDDAWRRWCLRERPEPEDVKPKPTPTAEEIAAGAADFERRKAAARAAVPVAAGPPPPPGVARR